MKIINGILSDIEEYTMENYFPNMNIMYHNSLKIVFIFYTCWVPNKYLTYNDYSENVCVM